VINFRTEQLLDRNFITVLDSKGKEVAYKLQYATEEIRSQEENKYLIQENKHRVKVILTSTLNPDQAPLKLIIKKGIDSLLKEDYTILLSFLPKLQQTREPQLINNRKICLYTNHQLYETYTRNGNPNPSPAKYFSTNPSSKKITTSSRDTAYREENSKNRCPEAKQDEYLTVLNTKLTPNTPYELLISKDLTDIYGQTIQGNISATPTQTVYASLDAVRPFTSQPVSEDDKQIFGPKFINTYPGNVPIVSSRGTTNLENFTVEACAMNADQYANYLAKGFNSKNCASYISTKQPTKNLNRELSTIQLDIEQDIFKKQIHEHFIALNAKKSTQDRGTDNLYLVSDFSLFFEQGTNKSLLFATDYSGVVLPDVQFDFYTIERNRNDRTKSTVKKLNIKVEINPSNGVYVINEDTTNKSISLIVAHNDAGLMSSIALDEDQIYNSDIAGNYLYGESTQNFVYLYTDRPLYKP
jgi:hypothetical protein